MVANFSEGPAVVGDDLQPPTPAEGQCQECGFPLESREHLSGLGVHGHVFSDKKEADKQRAASYAQAAREQAEREQEEARRIAIAAGLITDDKAPKTPKGD